MLLVDGGGENHAVSIEELIISTPHPEITKVIALKDIAFSNSPIEAINKIMKRYIRHNMPQTFKELLACIIKSIEDYNIFRPPYALNGLTPMETYTQKLPDIDFSEQTRQAKAIRLEKTEKVPVRSVKLLLSDTFYSYTLKISFLKRTVLQTYFINILNLFIFINFVVSKYYLRKDCGSCSEKNPLS